MGISDGAERGRESEAVDRVMAGRVRMIPRAHGTYDWHGLLQTCHFFGLYFSRDTGRVRQLLLQLGPTFKVILYNN